MTTNGFMAQHFFRHGSAFPWSTWNTHRFLLNLKSFKYISPLSFANLDASFLREGTSGNIFKIPSKNSTKNSPFKKWISSSFFHHLLITQMEVTKNPWKGHLKPPTRVTQKNLDYDMCLYKILFRHMRRMNLAYLCQSLAPFQKKKHLWAFWAFEGIQIPNTQCMMFENIYPLKLTSFVG